MLFHKYPFPVNFHYPGFSSVERDHSALTIRATRGYVRYQVWAGGLVRVVSALHGDDDNPSRVELAGGPLDLEYRDSEGLIDLVSAETELALDPADGSFCLTCQGSVVLESASSPFGRCGSRQIALFSRPKDAPVYGLGEKTGALDKRGKSYTFWNADVVADHGHSFGGDGFDPCYVSIPFLITKFKNDFFGIFLNNPYRTSIHTELKADPGNPFHSGNAGRDAGETHLAFAADDGPLDLFLIPGPSLADVVRRYARLTGAPEPPPLWALGYHQCKWSYESAAELAAVHQRLTDEKIPVASMWMDIDYMDNFKIFTFHKKNYKKKDRERAFAQIRETGTRLVAMVDPGVKREPGYRIYDEAMERGLFCQTPEGDPFTGLVWPGQTLFPDFTLSKTGDFWSKEIAAFMNHGIDGIWIDMNDPSTGAVDTQDMLFEEGETDHAAYHNQYADLMARATLAGMETHNPGRRHFLLTRSGFAGTQNYAAIWTGDNVSNETHLRMSIPQSINLALSGVSFSGPDIGGFIDDVTEDLLVYWTLAATMFPLFRNHTCKGTRPQEPFAFTKKALKHQRNAINTRLKLLPVLYTEFFRHWRDGDAVMRPLSYEFSKKKYENISDQFLIGSSLMAAPFTDVTSKQREVILPDGWWFDLHAGKWREGNRTLVIKREPDPFLFVRDGAILPALEGKKFFPQPDFSKLSFHVFTKEKDGAGLLFEDDGESRMEARRYNLWNLQYSRKTGRFLCEQLEAGLDRKAMGWIYFYGAAPKDAKSGKAEWPIQSYDVKKQKLDALTE